MNEIPKYLGPSFKEIVKFAQLIISGEWYRMDKKVHPKVEFPGNPEYSGYVSVVFQNWASSLAIWEGRKKMKEEAEKYIAETMYHAFPFQESYVPYLWNNFSSDAEPISLNEAYGSGTWRFVIDAADRELFPALRGRKTVKLYQSSDGFISEV